MRLFKVSPPNIGQSTFKRVLNTPAISRVGIFAWYSVRAMWRSDR